MRILVTGAAGYIGAILTQDLLLEGHEVIALDSFSRGKGSLLGCCSYSTFSFHQGDVRDAALMKALVGKADAIVSLAALVSPQSCLGKEAKAFDINVSSIKLLNDLRSANQPLLFMSTNIGYGTKERKAVYTEEDPLHPNSVYGLTKVAAEEVIAEKPGYVIFRPASAFGVSPTMQDHLLLNYYVSRAVEDRNLVLYDAAFRRNFIHVRDMSKAIRFTLVHHDRMKDNIFNLGMSDADMTKLELAQKIKAHLKDLYIHCHEGAATDPDARNYCVSNRKLESTGFSCSYSIEAGIRELIGYYQMKKMIQ